MLNGDQWSQLLRGFIDEAGDLIKQAEEYLLQLDQTPNDEDARTCAPDRRTAWSGK